MEQQRAGEVASGFLGAQSLVSAMTGLFQAWFNDRLFEAGTSALLGFPRRLFSFGQPQQQPSSLESSMIATVACFLVACFVVSLVLPWIIRPLQFVLTIVISFLVTPVMLDFYLSNTRR